jgi:hypothetical protein
MMVAVIPREPFLDGRAILRAVENTLQASAMDAKIDFDTTTTTWLARPEFKIEKRVGSRKVFTNDAIYAFLNYGTRVRYATMSPGFRPKTRSRYLGSNVGTGGMVFVRTDIPRPGIDAREFDLAVKEKWDRELPVLLQRAIDAEVSRQRRR